MRTELNDQKIKTAPGSKYTPPFPMAQKNGGFQKKPPIQTLMKITRLLSLNQKVFLNAGAYA
jgi:hypothetical protein